MEEHIDEFVLQRFIQGYLKEQEEIKVLEHIALCEQCAQRYSELMEHKIIKAPVGMKDTILQKQKYIQKQEQRKRLVFYQYCIKVGIGMAASLMFLFGNLSFYTKVEDFQVKAQIESIKFTDSMQEKIKNFQDKFLIKDF